jgi:hypothetical protein
MRVRWCVCGDERVVVWAWYHVDEEQLGRDGGGVVELTAFGSRLGVGLEGHVPRGDLVVVARHGQHGLLGRVPLDGRDGALVPLEVRSGLVPVDASHTLENVNIRKYTVDII